MQRPTYRAAMALALLPLTTTDASAAELQASDGVADDRFGASIALSGDMAISGALLRDIGTNDRQGTAYLFRNLTTATGTVTEHVQLIASDGEGNDRLGRSASISGNMALSGAFGHDIGANSLQGAAYLFRDLTTATGTITESAKLTASTGASQLLFGSSVALSGESAIVGASGEEVGVNNAQGAAYVFRELGTATGTITENVRLITSDGAASDQFGSSVSLQGELAVVGSHRHKVGANGLQGSAYVYRNLGTASGTVTEHAILNASDGEGTDHLGISVSLSGDSALVGAYGDEIGANSNQGSAYLFRNLSTATGTVTENAKLIASDGAAGDWFGGSVSFSGSHAIVGAASDDIGANNGQGSAYLFSNLGTASGTVTEQVKVIASDGALGDNFGESVSVDGDLFVIGADYGDGALANSGKAYTGTVSSLTTLDAGNSTATIDGISFVSRTDWTVGESTDYNSVTLGAGDTADVTAVGMTVAIGRDAGSDDNTLSVAGTLVATEISVGATGNLGNALVLRATGSIDGAMIRLAEGSFFSIEGDHTGAGDLLTRLGGSTLQTWDGMAWQDVTNGNQVELLDASYADGFTTFATIPEPGAAAMIPLACVSLLVRRRRA